MSSSHRNHRLSSAGLLVALGIIYGDIGTSPLYVMKAIIGDRAIDEQLVLGGISCVFWTLTIQTTFKYILLTLRADNKGEGGIFSLYALVRRYAPWVFVPATIGAATLLADGIITPPISVSSAIEGLAGVPGLEDMFTPGGDLTVGIVIAILSLIFFFQRFGTKVVGSTFGPIMLVWFAMLFVLGIVQVGHYPDVLRALSPHYAIDLLVNYPSGFWLLGAVFLCTTGAEALYSDLGHCGRKNIQTSWIFVKTALVINYMGQGAWLLHNGTSTLSGVNPFYALMPGWFLVPGVIVATFAAIIASQALITGSFTLISEAVSMNFWPRVAIKFPSDVRGQIYIPSVNWLLWAGCVGIMLSFRESGEMEAIYGFFISLAMAMTTVLMGLWLRYVRRWPIGLVFLVLAVFATVELAYFTANSVKILHRLSFFLVVIGLVNMMLMWYRARKLTNRFLDFKPLTDSAQAIIDLSRDRDVPKFATHLVYLTKANDARHVERKVLDSILRRRPKRADIYWFVHVNWTDEPYTMDYRVNELVDDKIIRVDLDLGFRVQPRINMIFKRIVQDLAECRELDFSSKYESLKRHDFDADIRYVILERFLSVENELNFQDEWLLDTYFLVKRFALSDQNAFGLDHTDTVVEHVPLLIGDPKRLPLRRMGASMTAPED
ncbi:MAG: KUP/HAK/KT family potassium transporter [Flavobacteriales bacterium]|jgi:KUP system potassium uptake protein|nr:KUP/HAK/KT family potassium transporter [Flavobacteriales bacterium]MBK7754021.1 KUP/HAK/KT family potassium transporter [Flavobacteriales bacterium]